MQSCEGTHLMLGSSKLVSVINRHMEIITKMLYCSIATKRLANYLKVMIGTNKAKLTVPYITK